MNKRTKIVCTMGPACDDENILREMILSGMNVARFNFSHGSHEEHHERMERVKRISRELDIPVGILLDTKGPEIRTGFLEGHAKVTLVAGSQVTVTAAETSEELQGTAERFYLDHLELPREVHEGSTILIDDGLIGLTVDSVEGQDILCTVQNGGELGEKKGVNVPNAKLSLPSITEQDRSDILFGLEEGIDFIAASFIRDADGVREIRHLCRENGGEHVDIFPKIECALAVYHFDEILKVSDGITVARGDLGVEVAPEVCPTIQKEIIAKCNAASKPVITATQMLDSMIRNPRPTRAEVTDVANAINDGTDAVMLCHALRRDGLRQVPARGRADDGEHRAHHRGDDSRAQAVRFRPYRSRPQPRECRRGSFRGDHGVQRGRQGHPHADELWPLRAPRVQFPPGAAHPGGYAQRVGHAQDDRVLGR